MKLYDAPFPGTRGSRVRWMLEETGAKFEHAPVDPTKGQHKQPEYLEVHPHGLIPAFEHDDLRLIESAAICMHLADIHPEQKLGPAVGTPDRARWYQWIVYAASTLDDALINMLFHAQILPEAKRRPELVERGRAVWSAAGPFLEKSLTGRDWLLGSQFTAADVAVGYDVGIAARLDLIAHLPNVAAYASRLAARPAFQRTFGAR